MGCLLNYLARTRSLTTGIQAVRVDLALRALAQLDCSEDVGRLGPAVGFANSKLRGVGGCQSVEVDAAAVSMAHARHKDHPRRVCRRRSSEEFRDKQLREEEGPDMVSGVLALQTVFGELEISPRAGRVVD